MESNFRSKIKPIASLRKKFNSDCAFLGVLQHNPLKEITMPSNTGYIPRNTLSTKRKFVKIQETTKN